MSLQVGQVKAYGSAFINSASVIGFHPRCGSIVQIIKTNCSDITLPQCEQ